MYFYAMKKYLLLFGSILLLAVSCKSKKAAENESFFPVLSFLKSQVAHIDTTIYPLMKIVTVDSVSDTSYIKREEFNTYANDFLSIPDISSDKLKNEYTESKMFEETLKRAIIDYTPKNNSTAEIRREEVMIAPGSETSNEVQSIIIDRVINKGDSTVQKKMLWQVNKRFQIVTIVQKPAQPDKISTTQIIWNDFPSTQ